MVRSHRWQGEKAVRSSWYPRSEYLANWNAGRIEVVEAMYVDSQVIWRNTLAMKRVYATNFAEEVPSSSGMELVLCQRRIAGNQLEVTLMHLDHESIPSTTDRTVAHREFWKVSFDLETNGAAVATALIPSNWSAAHLGARPHLRLELKEAAQASERARSDVKHSRQPGSSLVAD